MFVLKIKKMKQAQLEKAQNQMINIETMINGIETEQQQVDVFEAMKTGTAELNRIHECVALPGGGGGGGRNGREGGEKAQAGGGAG